MNIDGVRVYLYYVFILCLFSYSYSSRLLGFGGIDLQSKQCFQHCIVSLPAYYNIGENRWVYEESPAYCTPIGVQVGSLRKEDSSCVSIGSHDLCQLYHKVSIGTSSIAKDLAYRCNIYNATTGTFFYSGNILIEDVDC